MGPGDAPAQTLSLIAGLALIEAVDVAAPGQMLILKWPNDLLLSGRKLAGILLERSGNRVVIGFGVNLAFAPQIPGRDGASLSGRVSLQEFASLLSASFGRLLLLWRRSEPALVAQAWLARAHPVGTGLTVHSGTDEMVTGHFDGIEPDGALRLRLSQGMIEVVRAGDVEL